MSFFRKIGDMVWPVSASNLQWRLRYHPESITDSDRMVAAAILSAYQELIFLPAAKRNPIIAELRLGSNLPQRASEATKPDGEAA